MFFFKIEYPTSSIDAVALINDGIFIAFSCQHRAHSACACCNVFFDRIEKHFYWTKWRRNRRRKGNDSCFLTVIKIRIENCLIVTQEKNKNRKNRIFLVVISRETPISILDYIMSSCGEFYFLLSKWRYFHIFFRFTWKKQERNESNKLPKI